MEIPAPVITGIITGVIALIGVLYTQWRAERRENVRWVREQSSRALEHAREDAARTFDQRRDGYIALLGYLRELDAMARQHKAGDAPPGTLDDFTERFFALASNTNLYGSPEVLRLATVEWGVLVGWIWMDRPVGEDERRIGELEILVRKDLGIPPGEPWRTFD